MFKKNISSLLLTITTFSLFSMEIIENKKYKTKDGEIVTIIKDCKKAWDINSLEEAGEKINNVTILLYFMACVKESNKISILSSEENNVLHGDKESIKKCLDAKYHGLFYYVKNNNSLGMCVHPSWLIGSVDDQEQES